MNESEFLEWKEHPVTEWVLAGLLKDRAALMEAWADCRMPEQEQEECQIQCKVYKELADLNFNDVRVMHEGEE